MQVVIKIRVLNERMQETDFLFSMPKKFPSSSGSYPAAKYVHDERSTFRRRKLSKRSEKLKKFG